MHGTEVGNAIAYYVLDSLVGLDRQQVFFSQLQSRGLLQTCLADISNNSYQVCLSATFSLMCYFLLVVFFSILYTRNVWFTYMLTIIMWLC